MKLKNSKVNRFSQSLAHFLRRYSQTHAGTLDIIEYRTHARLDARDISFFIHTHAPLDARDLSIFIHTHARLDARDLSIFIPTT